MHKKMKLRRDGQCANCEIALPAGETAYWFKAEGLVRCCGCFDVAAPVPVAVEADVAGRSAQSEYSRRAARELARKKKVVEQDAEWREAVKDKHPVLGRIATTFTAKPTIGPESQPTKAWQVGAEGERRVAEVLTDVSGIEILHDRLVPGSRANIDHIVVGPSGVFVIDAKKYKGKIEVRDIGNIFNAKRHLYVNGRDRTKLVDGVLKQVEVVRKVLGDEFADVPVNGVLCFVGCEWGWIMKAKTVKGTVSLWPKALPDHVGAPGDLGDRVGMVASRLREKLKPAS